MDRRGFLEVIGGVALAGVSARTVLANDSGNALSTFGTPGHLKVTAMGVGGAGGSILDQVIASNVLSIDQSIYINTNSYRHVVSAADQKIVLGNGEWQPAISAARLALQERDRITAAIGNAGVLLLIAGMGGVAGTAIAPVVAKLARENGTLTVALLVTPFSFEGKRRFVAERGVFLMQTLADRTQVYSNEAYSRAVSGSTTRLQFFSLVNDAIIYDARAALSVVSGTYPPGFARPGVTSRLGRSLGAKPMES